MSDMRDTPIHPESKCSLCGHYMTSHIVVRYSSDEPNNDQRLEINCQEASRTNYQDKCCCNSGFKPIKQTVSFEEIEK